MFPRVGDMLRILCTVSAAICEETAHRGRGCAVFFIPLPQ